MTTHKNDAAEEFFEHDDFSHKNSNTKNGTLLASIGIAAVMGVGGFAAGLAIGNSNSSSSKDNDMSQMRGMGGQMGGGPGGSQMQGGSTSTINPNSSGATNTTNTNSNFATPFQSNSSNQMMKGGNMPGGNMPSGNSNSNSSQSTQN